jgi:hypothetical protein
MRAIVQERYGPPETLELREIEEPQVADDALFPLGRVVITVP